MTRKCNCAGGCGPQDEGVDGVTRREFVTLLGVGTAGALLSSTTASPAAAKQAAQAKADELARWKRNLRTSTPHVYHSDTHGDARLPLGGIGTGNFDIGVDGQFTTWQLFNTLRDGYVPFFFGIKAGTTARMLQTAGGPPGLPHIQRIEMTGEYPMAKLRFQDAALPVQVEMTAFSPFAPFDERTSSLPTAAFVFRIHNPTKTVQDVSLGAFLQNPLGYDALGPAISFNSVGFNEVTQKASVYHPNFGGNDNRLVRDGKATTLEMHLHPGTTPTLSQPLTIYTNTNVGDLNLFAVERPASLSVLGVDALPPNGVVPNPAQTVVWLEDAATSLAEPQLRAAREAASSGATVVFSGSTFPLLQAYAQAKATTGATQPAADIVFADFETNYGGWTVQGDAFGTEPVAGTLPNQQSVSGFRGSRLVNSFHNGDDTTGRLVSKPFVIDRNYIRFLVGGGDFPNTQVRLIVGEKTVQAASGKNEERLLPALWDVRSLRGQTAHIEIVDEQKGGWGHINVDHIEFSDLPFSRDLVDLLDEMLPAQFTAVRPASPSPGVAFDGLKPRDGATQTVARDGKTRVAGAMGKGRVILVTAPLLGPNETALIGARQRAYASLAEIVGVEYQTPTAIPETAPGFGTLALTTINTNATALETFTDWKTAWDTFAGKGSFQKDFGMAHGVASPAGQTVNGALAVPVRVPAGKTVDVVYHLSWHYPNKYHDGDRAQSIGNHYTTLWPDALAVSRDVTSRFTALHHATDQFRSTFYDSTLPYWLLDCISSQISTIRHIGVVFRTANSDIYGWEGSNGCCPPTCTHVWGYEQTLARLFPALERDMRRIDFRHQQRPDGGVNNRTAIPSPPHPTGEQPFSDGHASSVLKLYREVMNHQDDGYLKTYWPHAKRAVEYLIARDTATTSGGGGPDGTLSDDQWNTYDNAIHGVNSFIGTYYLAALRAGEEMARRVGEKETADRFHQIFLKGQDNLVKQCWNGEYFQQNLPGYDKRAGEYGPGCLSDQLIGQWWAHQLGLGYLLPREHVQTALKSVYKYNFLTDHSTFRHNWRKFAGGTDKGLLNCTWPKGGRPADTIPYVDEVWTGVEYQVAGHLIYEGLIDEAFAVIKGARDRYNGIPRAPIPRNPWNEIECGGHYARAMASWSLLLGLSGFEYDAPLQTLSIAPRLTPAKFKSFFSGPTGWGSISQTRRSKTQRNEVAVTAGTFSVKQVHLDVPAHMTTQRVRVTVGEKATTARFEQAGMRVTVTLSVPVTIQTGKTLAIVLS